jgi:hypothetical protein
MFSGNEWTWIILTLAIVGFLVVVWSLSVRRVKPVITHSALVRGTPAEVAHEVAASLAGRNGVSVHSWSDGIVLLEHRTVSAWSMVVAILAFPIGLLALIPRNVDAGTILITVAREDTTRVQFRGRFDPRDIARINEVISRRSTPPSSSAG